MKDEHKELEERIERKKKVIDDYLNLAPKLGIDSKTIERTLDMMLEDLSKMLKERK
jgi:hypothetical protein